MQQLQLQPARKQCPGILSGDGEWEVLRGLVKCRQMRKKRQGESRDSRLKRTKRFNVRKVFLQRNGIEKAGQFKIPKLKIPRNPILEFNSRRFLEFSRIPLVILTVENRAAPPSPKACLHADFPARCRSGASDEGEAMVAACNLAAEKIASLCADDTLPTL
jgi:hypothetical protein